MPKPQPQPDLFPSSLDAIVPAKSRNGPRLWIRRLVIWEAPGAILRDIALRPGLNIIWSPDGDADGTGMGHGGGKTSLCRLMRYCLGEDSFGDDGQRGRIGTALPDAHVGAEIVLDGAEWIVVRPIGNPRGRHLAQPGGGLDAAFTGDMANTTMSPLRHAIADAIMPIAIPHMPVGSSVDEGWEAALAWISRDQECRLLDPLDWRSADTRSRSPVRAMAKADRLAVVRLLLNALTPAEIEANRRAQAHGQAADTAAKRRDRIAWTRDDVARGLAEVFGSNPDAADAADLWMQKAQAEVDAEDPAIDEKLQAAERQVEEQRVEVNRIATRLAVIGAEQTGLGTILKLVGDNLPKAETRVQDARDRHCLSCGQSIPPEAESFIQERTAERDELARQKTETEEAQRNLRTEGDALKYDAAAADQELTRRKQTAANLGERAKRFAAARGYVTTTARYRMYGAEIDKVARQIADAEAEEATERRTADDLRDASKATIARLSAHFDAVVRFFISDEARGEVVLDDKGIHPQVLQHGTLTTAAVESLKVVAFDFAALIMAIEGGTQLPGFWLHDSPREADLGLPLYDRLFELALRLERLTPMPAFQYVITTTTRPPEPLQTVPWLRLTLSSAPPEQRLFCRDL